MEQIKKYISQAGVILEIGDFYGGGEDEVITSIEEEGTSLLIKTSCNEYPFTLKPGDYLLTTEGSGRVVKSKFDIDETD